ncbi:MAG TPA: serine hydrolase [Pyrinomonadaceae bacterium]|jgi:CubicO group peptidase (beta-lactamase class C family)
MKRILTIIMLTLTAAAWTYGQQTRPAVTSTAKTMSTAELSREIESYLDQLAAQDNFSGTILLAKDGVPFFKKAYGLASKGYNVPNRLDTKFNLGSMNKMFTSVAIAQLVEQGKFAYTDTVAKLLPDYPNQEVAAKITVHHLLTHTSGLGNYFNNKFMETSKDRFRTIKDFLPLFTSDPLQFEPGARWQYSNAGFIVLGAIVEKVSGQNYFDYVRDHIYKPAGMINTDAYEMDSDTPNMAIGYTRMGPNGPVPDAPRRTNLFLHSFKGGPAGGGFSTVEDLHRFAVALKEHKLLSQKYTDLITTGKVDLPRGGGEAKYAYGFQEEKINNQRRIGHGGGFPGINSELQIYPELGYTVAVMANYDPPTASRVAERVGDLLTGVPIQQAVKLSPEVLKKYAGRYEPTTEPKPPGMIDVILKDNNIWLLVSGGRHKFLPLSETEFFDEEYKDVRAIFSKDAQGQVTSLVLKNAGPKDLTARKVVLPEPSVKGNTTFRLKGFKDAQIVVLAGSFNNWSQSQTLFAREGDEWVSRIDLAPGKHTYKFIVDGEWMTDPGNPDTEDDGSGNTNSVLILKAP